MRLAGLLEPVTVLYDERRVPHIFAQNDRDLYFAQGYITARDRLWQMEFQTTAAAGRLAEILGPGVLERDRYQRRVGLVYGARNTLKDIMGEPETRLSVSAYTEGVNAYISSLRAREYPIEYKLLGYAPEPWTPLKCAILIKSMAWILRGGNAELRMNNTLDRFGEEVGTGSVLAPIRWRRYGDPGGNPMGIRAQESHPAGYAAHPRVDRHGKRRRNRKQQLGGLRNQDRQRASHIGE